MWSIALELLIHMDIALYSQHHTRYPLHIGGCDDGEPGRYHGDIKALSFPPPRFSFVQTAFSTFTDLCAVSTSDISVTAYPLEALVIVARGAVAAAPSPQPLIPSMCFLRRRENQVLIHTKLLAETYQ